MSKHDYAVSYSIPVTIYIYEDGITASSEEEAIEIGKSWAIKHLQELIDTCGHRYDISMEQQNLNTVKPKVNQVWHVYEDHCGDDIDRYAVPSSVHGLRSVGL